MSSQDIIGTWKLVSYELRRGERIQYPFGADPEGFIMYTPDGRMAAFVAPKNRKNFATSSITAGSMEEKAAAVDSFVSYCGRYEIRLDRVVHHVDMSLFPNWVGGKQERFFKLEGNQLTLSTAPLLMYGELQTAHLVWEKI